MKPAPSSTVRFKIMGKPFNVGQRDLVEDLSIGALLCISQGTCPENPKPLQRRGDGYSPWGPPHPPAKQSESRAEDSTSQHHSPMNVHLGKGPISRAEPSLN